MKQIRIGLLSKKRGNYRLQERLVGANVVEDTTDFEVTHHHDSLIKAGFEVQLIHWGPYFIRDVQDADLDIIFNVSSLVEAAILEDLEIPFVGSGTNGIALARSKPLAKRIWLQDGIPTSRFAVLRSMSDCEAFIKNPSVPFPLFA
jgi:D-alanine-D-alanine ligase